MATASIYHVMERAQLAEILMDGTGQLIEPSLATEGFIHFSTLAQTARVVNAYYSKAVAPVALVVDTSKLTAELRFESPAPPPGAVIPAQWQAAADDLYPHLYGALNLDAVTGWLDFTPAGPDGVRSPDVTRVRHLAELVQSVDVDTGASI